MSARQGQRFQLTLRSAAIGTRDPDIARVQGYLTRFGYLASTVAIGTLDKPTSAALERFQQVHGLATTGELDAATAAALERPRCGTPDLGVIAATRGGASASFVLRGCSYPTIRFAYRFVNGTADIAGTRERDAVRNAFATWAAALCGVTFEERAADPVDFEIGWFAGDHGDGSAFDGVGNTLAHAFYPPPCGGGHAGECHFDEAETWSLTGAGSTFDLETVALHEIGHLLGLDHSPVAGSVMFPSYGGVRRALTGDDLDGIRRLYPSLCRRGDSGSQAGFVAEIAAASRRNLVITAVRTQAGTLKLIAWSVAAEGAITRIGDSGDQAGAATSIAIARAPESTQFVTACRSGSGRLLLINWNVSPDGTIARLRDSGTQAGTASMIRLVAVGPNRFVTACRTGDGTISLIGWRLAGGVPVRLSDSGAQAGGALDLALVPLPGGRVLMAARATDGTLRLSTWRIDDDRIRRLAESGDQAGDARGIRAVIDQAGHVVTAVKAADNSLKLITWTIAADGGITRLGDSGDLAGETGGHDVSLAGGRVVTAVRAGDGHLKVIAWQTTADGGIARVGDSANLAGSASLITQCEQLAGVPPIVTSVRTASNALELIAWSMP